MNENAKRLECAAFRRFEPAPPAGCRRSRWSADDQPEDILPSDRAVGPAVGGVPAIVPHHKVLVLPAFEGLLLERSIGKGSRAGRKIRFSQFLAIYIHVAVFQIDRIAGHADDALDGNSVVGRITQNDDLAAVGSANMVNLASQQVV